MQGGQEIDEWKLVWLLHFHFICDIGREDRILAVSAPQCSPLFESLPDYLLITTDVQPRTSLSLTPDPTTLTSPASLM